MSSVRIRTRTTRRGDRRYMVAYRLGGRYGRDRSAGTFETLTLARARRMKVMELIARGEHDQIPELANPELATTAEPAGTWTELHQQWIDGTHNLKPSTKNTYQQHGRSLAKMIGDRDPTRFDWKDCRDLVTNLVEQGLAHEPSRPTSTRSSSSSTSQASSRTRPATGASNSPANPPNNHGYPAAPTSGRSAPTSPNTS